MRRILLTTLLAFLLVSPSSAAETICSTGKRLMNLDFEVDKETLKENFCHSDFSDGDFISFEVSKKYQNKIDIDYPSPNKIIAHLCDFKMQILINETNDGYSQEVFCVYKEKN